MEMNLLSNALEFLENGTAIMSREIPESRESAKFWKHATIQTAQGIELIILFYLFLHDPSEMVPDRNPRKSILVDGIVKGRLKTVSAHEAQSRLIKLLDEEKFDLNAGLYTNRFAYRLDASRLVECFREFRKDLNELRSKRNCFTHFHVKIDDEDEDAKLERTVLRSLQLAVELASQVVNQGGYKPFADENLVFDELIAGQ